MRHNSSLSNHSPLTAFLRLLMVLSCAILMVGCASVRYYSQALGGHLDLIGRREPIEQLIADPQTPQELRQRLNTVLEIRRFAVSELSLPDNKSYTFYADLERDAAVYLLTAAPELSLEPKSWCYLVLGCLSYRGYFDAAEASSEADRLVHDGYDTRISPGLAYSTLGLMADPVLNTMLVYPDHQLAEILFHELAHQVVFVKGDTTFSESFATTVGQIGKQRWLASRGQSPDSGALAREQDREQAFNKLMMAARARLIELYSAPLGDQEKRAGKARIYTQLSEDYARLRTSWDGYPGYDSWFEDGPNNADLALISNYQSQVNALLALYRELGDDLPAFYRRVAELGQLDPELRKQTLDRHGNAH
jgi:predicted aminopeptidase